MKKLFFGSLSFKAVIMAAIMPFSFSVVYAGGDFDPKPPTDPQYHYYYPVTVSVSPEGAGWASGADKYEAGTNVWLYTSANQGYVFSHWEKDGEFYSDKQSLSFKMGEERPNFVAFYDYKPEAPGDPQNNYEPKKRLYLTCNQADCSFNRTSGDKAVIGKNVGIQAYINQGYRVVGWYEGDSLVATTSGFNFRMPDHDVTLRIEIEYSPSTPDDPASQGGNIALEYDNLDDIDPYVANSLFYFEETSFTYTGKPLVLGYYSRLNPEVNAIGDLGVNVGSYTSQIDVTIKNDSIDTHKVFNFSYTIKPAQLEASAGNYTKVYGEDNPEFTVSYKGFLNGEDESVLTTVPVISTQADKSTGAGKYDLTLSAGAADNYTVVTKNGKLTIEPAPLTVTPSNVEITYGTDVSGITFDYSITGFVNGDSADCLKSNPVVKVDAKNYSNAGTYPITASKAAADNYTISYDTGMFVVNKAPLTITPADLTISYGVDLKTLKLDLTYEGFVNGDNESVLTVKPFPVIPDSLSSTGVYELRITGAQAANYEISYGTAKLTIDKSVLFLAVKSVSREYGEENPVFEYAVVDATGKDMSSVLTGEPTYTCEATAKSGVGKYEIVVSGTGNDNYSVTCVNGFLTITPATLTVTADNVEYEQGSGELKFTYTIEGFKNGEDESVLTKKPEVSCSATDQSPAGRYVIRASGAEAANYVFVYVNGTLNLTTGVIGIETDEIYPVYDLLGRKVGSTADELAPGIYLINGRKFIVN